MPPAATALSTTSLTLSLLSKEAGQDFSRLVCVRNILLGELLELGLGQQHNVDSVSNDHARGHLVGELRVERKAKLLEERLGPVEVPCGMFTKIFVAIASSS